ncbi:amino acid exporter, AAE family [Pedococcus dokdonensis]|uniref:Amino acid exporter, AAE family n=1 Tax=Pedococcus dokdonensis TaxID=443156 RepID=A0A1H0Q226_9MICO|nr:amino acid exporter, AAE family [Pedococcus dokdonensis]
MQRHAGTMTTPTARTGLSIPQGTALSIGAVLGTGVITLPAIAAGIAGPASLVAWAALVVLSIPLASTFAAMGARFPDTGGVSTYVRRAFGPRASAAVGWCFFFAVPVGAPPASLMAGHYVADALGGGRPVAVTVAASLVVGVALMNAAGLRLSGRVQLVLTAVLATLMVVTIVAALPHASWANLRPFAPHGWGAVGSAAALLVWGFAGWEAVASLAGDYRRPARDVPRATAIALVVVGALYLALAATSLTVLGPATGSSEAPLSDLLAAGTGGEVRVVTAVVAVLLTVGAMNAYFAGGSRLGAALARDGALPIGLAAGSGPGEVPRRSLALIATQSVLWLVASEVLHLGLTPLMLLATGCFTLVYVLGTAAAVRLLERGTRAWWTAVVALSSVLGLLVMNGWHVLWALGVAGAAVVYQWWSGRRGRLARRPVRQRLEERAVERREVVGVAAGDEVAVLDDLLVDPLGPGVAQVGLQARPARDGAALQHVGLDQRPRGVADGRDRLAAGHEVADEGDCVGVGAQCVGVGHPTGQDQGVEVVDGGR